MISKIWTEAPELPWNASFLSIISWHRIIFSSSARVAEAGITICRSSAAPLWAEAKMLTSTTAQTQTRLRERKSAPYLNPRIKLPFFWSKSCGEVSDVLLVCHGAILLTDEDRVKKHFWPGAPPSSRKSHLEILIFSVFQTQNRVCLSNEVENYLSDVSEMSGILGDLLKFHLCCNQVLKVFNNNSWKYKFLKISKIN